MAISAAIALPVSSMDRRRTNTAPHSHPQESLSTEMRCRRRMLATIAYALLEPMYDASAYMYTTTCSIKFFRRRLDCLEHGLRIHRRVAEFNAKLNPTFDPISDGGNELGDDRDAFNWTDSWSSVSRQPSRMYRSTVKR